MAKEIDRGVRVSAGVKKLDSIDKDWYKLINVNSLDMVNADCCLVCQLKHADRNKFGKLSEFDEAFGFDEYGSHGFDEYGSHGFDEYGSHNRDYSALTDLWIDVINVKIMYDKAKTDEYLEYLGIYNKVEKVGIQDQGFTVEEIKKILKEKKHAKMNNMKSKAFTKIADLLRQELSVSHFGAEVIYNKMEELYKIYKESKT